MKGTENQVSRGMYVAGKKGSQGRGRGRENAKICEMKETERCVTDLMAEEGEEE